MTGDNRDYADYQKQQVALLEKHTQMVYTTSGHTSQVVGNVWQYNPQDGHSWKYNPSDGSSFQWVDDYKENLWKDSFNIDPAKIWGDVHVNISTVIIDNVMSATKFLARHYCSLFNIGEWIREPINMKFNKFIVVNFVSKQETMELDNASQWGQYTSDHTNYQLHDNKLRQAFPQRETYYVPLDLIVDPFALEGSEAEVLEEIVASLRNKWKIA